MQQTSTVASPVTGSSSATVVDRRHIMNAIKAEMTLFDSTGKRGSWLKSDTHYNVRICWQFHRRRRKRKGRFLPLDCLRLNCVQDSVTTRCVFLSPSIFRSGVNKDRVQSYRYFFLHSCKVALPV